MSQRNTLEAKRARKQRKQLRAGAALPAYIDVVEWIRLRHRMSRGKARSVISHGAIYTRGGNRIRDRFIPASFRGDLVVRPIKND